jgi:glutamate synthase domain-containing protein 3
MTNGTVIVLGQTGRNFAAGMSGGIAYVFDPTGDFARVRCNRSGVDLEPIFEAADITILETLIRKHVGYTSSPLGGRILDNWPQSLRSFIKVFPHEYKRALQSGQPSVRKIPTPPPAAFPAAIIAGGTR